MSDLYQSNRKLVETYRQKLQQKIVSLHQARQSSNNSDIDPQKFYLGFKDRAIELVHAGIPSNDHTIAGCQRVDSPPTPQENWDGICLDPPVAVTIRKLDRDIYVRIRPTKSCNGALISLYRIRVESCSAMVRRGRRTDQPNQHSNTKTEFFHNSEFLRAG